MKVRISDIRSFFGTPKNTSIIPVIVRFLEGSNFAAEGVGFEPTRDLTAPNGFRADP